MRTNNSVAPKSMHPRALSSYQMQKLTLFVIFCKQQDVFAKETEKTSLQANFFFFKCCDIIVKKKKLCSHGLFSTKTKNSKSQHLAAPGCQGLVTPAGAAADGELQTFWELGRMDLLEPEKAEL